MIHVFGGTSDARLICQLLDQAGEHYSLSVASDAGKQLAGSILGDVVVGRMDSDAIARYLRQKHIRWVIDASHPYANALSENVMIACDAQEVWLTRYQRPSEIDRISHPLLHKVDDVDEACRVAQTLGTRVLLTTGSKQLAQYQRGLQGKTLLVRVLPSAEVLVQCEALGLGIDNIIALRGPFSASFNRALYAFCQPDVVITKESGHEGGYLQKVEPCLALGIPCIVVRRPPSLAAERWNEQVGSLEAFAQRLSLWQQQRGK
ncbi:cobalt-precorrin 6A reductase [Serratia fonticola]|uniref:Cobalt-precorrin 6A reductase n=1 Tax=Serratia fonticola TaxID=47917 RepID=A0A542BNI9_SERFO|nr:cobalt-precorrin-6A reductase [Serratia fonticola]TQI80152.1 cobalt-precorrin 6A reductase [Serratia fonticola]TQI97821.1 cobalt-precorrin 6A reductase [Serratia fonticola]TVZ72319.1 cobalt-precorrin 6A reductase [Serratia fonticola]